MFKRILLLVLLSLSINNTFAKTDIINTNDFEIELFSKVNNFMSLRKNNDYAIVFERFGLQIKIECDMNYENCYSNNARKVIVVFDVIDNLSKQAKVYYYDKPYTILYQGIVINVN